MARLLTYLLDIVNLLKRRYIESQILLDDLTVLIVLCLVQMKSDCVMLAISHYVDCKTVY